MFANIKKKLTTQLKSKYGGKKGYVKYWFYFVMYSLKNKQIDVRWSNVKRIIYICRGNICRSPYAAHYSQQLGINSSSYGLQVTQSRSAYATAIKVAKRRNVNLSAHTSTSISSYKHQMGDLFVVFEPHHVHQLKQRKIHLETPIILLGHYHPEKHISYIHDPYGKEESYFDQCFSVIEKSMQQILHLMGSNK